MGPNIQTNAHMHGNCGSQHRALPGKIYSNRNESMHLDVKITIQPIRRVEMVAGGKCQIVCAVDTTK